MSKQMNGFIHMGSREKEKKNFFQLKILLMDAKVVSKRHANKSFAKKKKKRARQRERERN